LYVREGVHLEPLAVGGTQEFDRRAGTENLAGMVGMAAALVRAYDARAQRVRHYVECRDALIDGVLHGVSDVRLTGHPTRRLPSIASFAFKAIEGESLVINLDLEGIDTSTGAACTSGSVEPSHVTEALGLPDGYLRGGLRCSVGVQNTAAEMRRVVETICRHADRLRVLARARAGRPEARQVH
jgi:cysteine desulfurase